MKTKRCAWFAVVLGSCMALVSCKESDVVYSTDTEGKEFRSIELAIPVGTVTVPLYETIKNKLNTTDDIHTDEHGVMYIEYAQSDSISWTEEIGLDEEKLHMEAMLDPTDLGSLPDDFPIPDVTGYTFTHSGEQSVPLVTSEENSYVTRVSFSGGNLEFDLPSEYFDGQINISILGLRKGEASFSEEYILSNGNVSPSPVVDLSDYELSSDDVTHEFGIKYDFALNSRGNTSNDITISADFVPVVSSLFGYFGSTNKDQITAGDTIAFDLFKDFQINNRFSFEDILLTIDVSNKLGIPMAIKGKLEMLAGKQEVPDMIKLNEALDFDIIAATQTNGTVTAGKTRVERKATINLGGSEKPDALAFVVGGSINPAGPTPNFLIKEDGKDNLVKVDLKLHVPFKFKTDNYVRNDTVSFDFNDMIKEKPEISECLDEASLGLSIDNGLPFKVLLEIIAIDGKGNDVENLTEPALEIKSAETDATGKVVAQQHSELTLKLTQAQIKKFKDQEVKHLILRSGLSTSGEGSFDSKKAVVLDNTESLKIGVSLRSQVHIIPKLFD
ncbi:MAG: hypothetical protein LBR08_06810 [Bacteroidales bacterium]|jgi:hypothetical protein|nr:hypothetical protein [Bacteroidales bacterium]